MTRSSGHWPFLLPAQSQLRWFVQPREKLSPCRRRWTIPRVRYLTDRQALTTLLGESRDVRMSIVSTWTLWTTCLNSLSAEPRDSRRRATILRTSPIKQPTWMLSGVNPTSALNSKIDLALTLRMVRATVRMRKRASEHVSLAAYHDPSNMLTAIFLEPHAAWNISLHGIHVCSRNIWSSACSNTTSPPSHCHISAISWASHY